MNLLSKLTSTIFVWASFHATGQVPILDSIKFNAQSKLAAFYPYPVTNSMDSTYDKYNFAVNDPEVIKGIVKSLKIGKETDPIQEMPGGHLFFIQDNKAKLHMFLNFKKSTIFINGDTYFCNYDFLKRLHKQYPLQMKRVVKTFESENQFDQYFLKEKEHKKLLFCWPPWFEFAGSVAIIFPHNKRFNVPKDVFVYLDSLMAPLAAKKEYNVTYSPESGSTENHKTFPITISCSKILGDKIQANHAETQPWKPDIKEAYFFYKQ